MTHVLGLDGSIQSQERGSAGFSGELAMDMMGLNCL